MTFSDAALARRARRAYELARARQAIVRALPIAIVLALAAARVERSNALVLAALALAAVVAGGWFGRGVARAVRTGAIAGLFPLLAPLIVNALLHQCAGCAPASPWPLCLIACAVGGGLAGLWAGIRAPALRPVEVAAALGTAALVGAVGCLAAGGFGLLGLASGLVLGGVPAVLVRAARGA
jgi:hypothetical protein